MDFLKKKKSFYIKISFCDIFLMIDQRWYNVWNLKPSADLEVQLMQLNHCVGVHSNYWNTLLRNLKTLTIHKFLSLDPPLKTVIHKLSSMRCKLKYVLRFWKIIEWMRFYSLLRKFCFSFKIGIRILFILLFCLAVFVSRCFHCNFLLSSLIEIKVLI